MKNEQLKWYKKKGDPYLYSFVIIDSDWTQKYFSTKELFYKFGRSFCGGITDEKVILSFEFMKLNKFKEFAPPKKIKYCKSIKDVW